MSIDPMKVWADMKLKVWPERYWLFDLGQNRTALAVEALSQSASTYCCIIRDQAGCALLIDEASSVLPVLETEDCDRFGPFRIVSTDGHLPFDVIGFLRPALEDLNALGIKAGPQCSAVFDHFFIYEKDIQRAERVLDDLIGRAKETATKSGLA